jgi:lysophospholipase L1-like esterase
LRQVWLGLLGLTMTCARPASLPVAHAKPPMPAAVAKPKPSSAPANPAKTRDAAALVAGPLAHFFSALTELRQQKRQRHVRVFWLGDSHTNADFLSGAVRSALGASFGDGGPGFVRIGAKPYRHEGVKVSRDGSWNIDPDPPARRSLQDDGVFGLGGTRAVPGAEASFAAQVTTRDGASDPATFELSYTVPENASFSLELAGKKQRVDAKAPADVAASGIAHLTLTAPLKSSLVLSSLGGAPRLFGLIVERSGAPGVVVDTAGIDGARLETPLAWNESAFVAEVARRAPELFVIAFGTNEAFDALKVERYGPQLSDLVQRMRKGAPQASCLVLGPTDAPLGDGSVPRVAEVANVLQRSATQLRCSFVSLQQLMGGEGSFFRGMKAKERLAQPDKLHLTPRGYQELGAALAQQLLDAYWAGRADLP